jgi:hypothetical protein
MFDFASPVLSAAQGIDDVQRADLHDIFHEAKDDDDLAQRLSSYSAPDEVKRKLIDAKIESQGPVEKAFAVIDRLGGLDKAEKNSTVARALIAVATRSSHE